MTYLNEKVEHRTQQIIYVFIAFILKTVSENFFIYRNET